MEQSRMADHGAAETGTATGTDYADHLRTYDGFINLAKYGAIGLVILMILMAFFLL
jgi:hypothetical protein